MEFADRSALDVASMVAGFCSIASIAGGSAIEELTLAAGFADLELESGQDFCGALI